MSDLEMAMDDEERTQPAKTISYDDETIIWEGGPSQWVNFSTYLFWIVIFIAVGAFSIVWNNSLKNNYTSEIITLVSYVTSILFALGVFNILLSYLTVKYEYTIITNNKIKEAKGITRIFRQEKLCEISDIKDITSPPAGLLGLVGLSTLKIPTNDDDQPLIVIRAIKDREDLINNLLPIWRQLKMDRKGYFGDR